MIEDKIILHIGLGRTSTTTLQENIFPQLSKIYKYKFIHHNIIDNKNQDHDLTDMISKHISRMQLFKKPKALKIEDKVFISSESLSCWNPIFYESFADDNLFAFGENVHVLIVIREPLNYLNSVYDHQILRAVQNYVKPSRYFIDSRKSPNIKFCPYASLNFTLDLFSYKNLINFYKKRFNKVTVVKYECLKDMEFLNQLFPVTISEIKMLRKNYQKTVLNRSKKISKFILSVSNILFFFKKCINKIKLRYNLIMKRPNANIEKLNRQEKYIYKKIYNFLFLNGRLYSEDLYKINLINWINDLFNFKPFNINLNKLVDTKIIKQMKEEYLQIPSIITYTKKTESIKATDNSKSI